MKAITHYVFSVGATLYLLSLYHVLSPSYLFMALWLSLSVNFLIDGLGHTTRNHTPVRSWVTHSVFTAPIWGGAIATVSTIATMGVASPGLNLSQTLFWGVMGATVALGHLFLDSLTEGGIFWLGRRFAVAHFRYDNVLLNSAFALLGIFLAAASLTN